MERCNCCGNQLDSFCKGYTRITIQSSNSTLGRYAHNRLPTRAHSSAFHRCQKVKDLKSPSTDGWINKH